MLASRTSLVWLRADVVSCLTLGVAGSAEASAFLYRRVYPDFARDDGVRWPTVDRAPSGPGGRAGHGRLLSGFPFARGYRRARLHRSHMLAGRHIVRYAEAPVRKNLSRPPRRSAVGVGGGR